MAVVEFQNKLISAKQGAVETENVRDRFIFLLKAMELVE